MAASQSASAGTDRGSPLKELNKSTAALSTWIFKVVKSEIIDYDYEWNGRKVENKKVRVIFVSLDEGQYLLGLAKCAKSKAAELGPIKDKYPEGPCDGLNPLHS